MRMRRDMGAKARLAIAESARGVEPLHHIKSSLQVRLHQHHPRSTECKQSGAQEEDGVLTPPIRHRRT